MTRKIIRISTIVFLFVLSTTEAFSQCAMCKAVAESSSGNKAAQGLNDGILYLMFVPYFLMGVVAVAWYFHNKRNKARDLEI